MNPRHFQDSAGDHPRKKMLNGKIFWRCFDCDACGIRRRGRSRTTFCTRYKKAVRHPVSGPIEKWCGLKNYKKSVLNF